MLYIVQEIQTASSGSAAFLPPVVKEDQIQAESDFYIKVGYAAISEVWEHTVMMFTETGKLLKAKCYKHDASGTQVIEDNDPEEDDPPAEV